MGWHMDDWGWGGWLTMTAGMVAFWAVVAWVVVAAIRAGRPSSPRTPDPEQLLAQRFAAGEIEDDEFHRRLDSLRGAAKAT